MKAFFLVSMSFTASARCYHKIEPNIFGLFGPHTKENVCFDLIQIDLYSNDSSPLLTSTLQQQIFLIPDTLRFLCGSKDGILPTLNQSC